MTNHLAPNLNKANILFLVKFALLGALIAGSYGVLHDQITYSISPEYFTKLKFKQFSYANLGLGDRVFVSTIGFLATWWVGLLAGWLLARRFVDVSPYTLARKKIFSGFLIIFMCGLLFGVAAYAYGNLIPPDLQEWQRRLRYYGVTDSVSFIRVAYIHNCSYAGGFLGLIISLVFLGKVRNPEIKNA
jgi:Na+-transporting NADH:ubiquinone oxidoreductase subunit NqrB